MSEDNRRVLVVSGTSVDHLAAADVALMLAAAGQDAILIDRDDARKMSDIDWRALDFEPAVVTLDMRKQSDWSATAHLRTPARDIKHFETPKPLSKRARRRMKGRGL